MEQIEIGICAFARKCIFGTEPTAHDNFEPASKPSKFLQVKDKISNFIK